MTPAPLPLNAAFVRWVDEISNQLGSLLREHARPADADAVTYCADVLCKAAVADATEAANA